jgi:hypothetical protein
MLGMFARKPKKEVEESKTAPLPSAAESSDSERA